MSGTPVVLTAPSGRKMPVTLRAPKDRPRRRPPADDGKSPVGKIEFYEQPGAPRRRK